MHHVYQQSSIVKVLFNLQQPYFLELLIHFHFHKVAANLNECKILFPTFSPNRVSIAVDIILYNWPLSSLDTENYLTHL